MNYIPIVFAFDNNLVLPAAICIYSLLSNAKENTKYDIFILKRNGENLDLSFVEKIITQYSGHKLTVKEVGDTFDNSFEIRGITTPAYYRLLIPSLIPEYDRVIYSDVDIIFRQDLADIYYEDLNGNILAGVNNLAHIDTDLFKYYEGTLHLNPKTIICSGFLVMNTSAMRKENIETTFIELAKNRYKFQDQDVLNIACAGRIKMLQPKFSLLTYITVYAMKDKKLFAPLWSEYEVDEALREGNIHYNGQKPWRGYCINFDIWWEYYRKSPIFDEKFYFDFFSKKINEYDKLPLIKRIKILARYFIYRP